MGTRVGRQRIESEMILVDRLRLEARAFAAPIMRADTDRVYECNVIR